MEECNQECGSGDRPELDMETGEQPSQFSYNLGAWAAAHLKEAAQCSRDF